MPSVFILASPALMAWYLTSRFAVCNCGVVVKHDCGYRLKVGLLVNGVKQFSIQKVTLLRLADKNKVKEEKCDPESPHNWRICDFREVSVRVLLAKKKVSYSEQMGSRLQDALIPGTSSAECRSGGTATPHTSPPTRVMESHWDTEAVQSPGK